MKREASNILCYTFLMDLMASSLQSAKSKKKFAKIPFLSKSVSENESNNKTKKSIVNELKPVIFSVRIISLMTKSSRTRAITASPSEIGFSVQVCTEFSKDT